MPGGEAKVTPVRVRTGFLALANPATPNTNHETGGSKKQLDSTSVYEQHDPG